MPKASTETINALYKEYEEVMKMDYCYVDVSGISTNPNQTTFSLKSCEREEICPYRIAGIYITANTIKDFETAFDILFGNSLTASNIGAYLKLCETKQSFDGKLHPAQSLRQSWVPDHQIHHWLSPNKKLLCPCSATLFSAAHCPDLPIKLLQTCTIKELPKHAAACHKEGKKSS